MGGDVFALKKWFLLCWKRTKGNQPTYIWKQCKVTSFWKRRSEILVICAGPCAGRPTLRPVHTYCPSCAGGLRMTTSARPALSICPRFKRPKPRPNDIETFRIIYRWKGMEVYFLLQFMEWHFDVCRKSYGQLSDQRSDSDDSSDALF